VRQEGIQLALQNEENIEILESEQHMCLDCENNGQALARETACNINVIYGAKQHRGTTTAKTPRDYAL